MRENKKSLFFLTFFIFSCALSVLSACNSIPVEGASITAATINASPTTALTLTPNATATPETTPTTMPLISTETQIPLSSTATPLPEEYYIRNISGHKQYFSLGCETSAAIDWAVYFGVTINEFEFQTLLPLSDNPDLGFVGTVDGPWGQVPPYAYGVHAEPVAALLREYGVPAKAYKNYTIEQIKEHIALGRPVIAWVIGNVVGGVPYEYTDKVGNKTIVAAYEHVIIITGYNKEKIRYMNNGNFYEAPYETFLNSWGILQNMVIVNENS